MAYVAFGSRFADGSVVEPGLFQMPLQRQEAALGAVLTSYDDRSSFLLISQATEDQAVDRVHRLGQTRAVTVVRFVVEVRIQ